MRDKHKSFDSSTSCSSNHTEDLTYNGCIITTGSLSCNLRMQNHALAWAKASKYVPQKEEEQPNTALYRLFNKEQPLSDNTKPKDTISWNKIYVLSTNSQGFYGNIGEDESSTLVFIDTFDIGQFIRRYLLLDTLNNLSISLETGDTGTWQSYRNRLLLFLINVFAGIMYLSSLVIKTVFIFVRYFVALISIPRLKSVIVMSPPCFPTVLVCILARLFIKDLRVIVDVHNYMFCMLIPPTYLVVPDTRNITLVDRTCLIFHRVTSYFLGLLARVLSDIEGACYSRCNIILTVSDAMKDDIRTRWGLKSCVYRDRQSPENKVLDDLEKHVIFYKFFNGTREITPLIASFNPNIRESIPSFGSIDSISRIYKVRDYLKRASLRKGNPSLFQGISIASHKFLFESDSIDIDQEALDSSILDGIYREGLLKGKGVWSIADFTQEENTITTVSLFVNRNNKIFDILSERLDLLDSSKFKDVVYVEETVFGRLVLISKQNSTGLDLSKRNLRFKIFGNTDGIFVIYKRKKDRPAFAIAPTSFSLDEDLGMLLGAIKRYDDMYTNSLKDYVLEVGQLSPPLVLVITGDGPKKSQFKDMVSKTTLRNTVIRFAFVKSCDYFNFIGSADFGISMHTSFSGLDLPIKIITMQGCGLPVISYRYGAVSELLHHRFNGMLFSSLHELSQILIDSLIGFPYNYDNGSPEESPTQSTLARLKSKLGGRYALRFSMDPGDLNLSCFRVFSLSDMIINARKPFGCDFVQEWKKKVKPLVCL